MRYLYVSAVLVLMVAVSNAAAQTPRPSSSASNTQAPPPGQTQPSNGRAPAISEGPPYRLDIAGDANITGTYRVNGVPISATSNWTQAGNNILYTTGNVGIGSTLSPSARLQVEAAVNNTGVFATSSSGTAVFGSSNSAYGVLGSSSSGTGVLGSSTSGYGVFGVSNDSVAVYGNGATGDGVYGTSISGHGVSGNSTNNVAVYGISVSNHGVSGTSNTGNGVAGWSTSGTGVSGYSSTGWAGYFDGPLGVDGVACATNVPCGSDARLKQDIAPLPYGLREALQLRPVRWQWKDKTSTQLNFGLIAQEVEPVLPELILHNVDTQGSLGLNYSGLIPVLINAVQQQQDTIAALTAANTTLESRVRALEQAMQRLLEPREVRPPLTRN